MWQVLGSQAAARQSPSKSQSKSWRSLHIYTHHHNSTYHLLEKVPLKVNLNLGDHYTFISITIIAHIEQFPFTRLCAKTKGKQLLLLLSSSVLLLSWSKLWHSRGEGLTHDHCTTPRSYLSHMAADWHLFWLWKLIVKSKGIYWEKNASFFCSLQSFYKF